MREIHFLTWYTAVLALQWHTRALVRAPFTHLPHLHPVAPRSPRRLSASAAAAGRR